MLVYQRVFYKIKGQSPIFRHTEFVQKKIWSLQTNFPTCGHSNCPSGTLAPDNGEQKQLLYVVISYKARQRYYIYPWIMAKIRDSPARQVWLPKGIAAPRKIEVGKEHSKKLNPFYLCEFWMVLGVAILSMFDAYFESSEISPGRQEQLSFYAFRHIYFLAILQLAPLYLV